MLNHFFTLPNMLSCLRIAGAPVLAVLIFGHHWSLAFVLFSVAAASDLADGAIARFTRTVSTFGRWLDPLADRILILSLVLALVAVMVLPVWLAVIIFVRDGCLAIGIIWWAKQDLPPISVIVIGKINTLLQYLLIAWFLLGKFADFVDHRYDGILIAIVAGAGLGSLVGYGYHAIRLWHRVK